MRVPVPPEAKQEARHDARQVCRVGGDGGGRALHCLPNALGHGKHVSGKDKVKGHALNLPLSSDKVRRPQVHRLDAKDDARETATARHGHFGVGSEKRKG